MNGHYNVGDIVLNNWTLTRLLGQDSAGCVFEAVQNDSGLMDKAAVKILTVPQSLNDIMNIMADGMDKESVIEFFKGSIGDLLEEFLLMTKLQNFPNIMSYDEHQVLEHTEGIGWDIILRTQLLTPLISYTQSRQLERENVIRLGIDICRALEYSEEFSIVHGDIKPGNIFLSSEGEFILGDFGITRILQKTSTGFTKNAYTAPEIYRGESYRHSTDIYSLGVVLYWLLNNSRTPFMPDFPSPITHTARDLALIRQLQGEPFPIPDNVDDQLAQVMLRACAFNPRKRYGTPALMRTDLEAVLNGRELSREPTASAAGTASAVGAASDFDDSDRYDSYETDSSEDNFYEILKDKTPEPYSVTSYSEYDDHTDMDDSEPRQQRQQPQINFENELYDDVGREQSFIASALAFAKSNLTMVALVAAAVAVVIIALFIFLPLGEEEPPPPDPALEDIIPEPEPVVTIPIPDFTAMTYLEILQDDRLRDVFTFNTDTESYSDTVPEGGIISQTPAANTEQEVSPLGDRIRVDLVMSLGPEPHPLDGLESVEIRHGVNPLPGRAANNPGLTLRLLDDPEIILTARILPTDFDFTQFTTEELEEFIVWESSNEDIFEIRASNVADFTVRIYATGTGNASLFIRIGDIEDRITVTVAN